jgi:CheY-like chemotaxis protein
VDPSALEAAVLNVALNARDAMPDGGTLTIRARRAEVTAAVATTDELQPGTYVALEIEDSGAGMHPDVASRAFEPFFTTKPAGQGTGLGLSMVYGFAKQSGGSAAIVSEPGRGTTIRILIPSATAAGAALVVDDSPRTTFNPSRVVLLVEDEPAVRDTIRRQLGLLGHAVITAGSADEAIGVLKSAGGERANLLLTDVVLRVGVDGIALAGESRRLRPDMPVILMSGYTAVPGAMERIRAAGAALLSKPFTSSQLDAAIQIVCGNG